DTGEFTLEHRTPERTYRLASIAVTDQQPKPKPSSADEFAHLRTNRDMAEQRKRIEPFLTGRPTRHSHSSPRWTWACPKASQSFTPARCIPKWSATNPAAARSVG